MVDKPVILAVDDDPGVLAAVVRDLRKQYGADYEIARAESGASALEKLGALKLGNRDVALMVVDQRMPKMTGVEFLREAIVHFPMPSACCSPPMPTRKRRSRRSTRCGSTTI